MYIIEWGSQIMFFSEAHRGFSYFREWALERAGSVAVVHRLSFPAPF